MSAVTNNDGQEHTADSKPGIKISRYWYLLVVLVVGVSGFAYWWCFFAFTDQGYMPEQPIHFSHKLHAGKHSIPCQYCHFNAQKSRHAGVPPLSICLGCHDTPNGGGVHADKPEIKKLLSLAKGRPAALQPGASYASDDDGDRRDPGVVKEGGMIHWNRVHQLPDHVYFSHEWHIKAGVSCKTCHGPVQEMDVVRQFAPLTMGWCVTCHRKDNYVSYNSKRSGLENHYDPKDPSTFRVGLGNYDVIRHNVRPDRDAEFSNRETLAHRNAEKNGTEGAEGVGAEHAEAGKAVAEAGDTDKLRGVFDESDNADNKLLNRDYFSSAQAEHLKKLLSDYPELPRWRVADLPETHKAFYGKMMHQNAPTQCSTCHQ